MLALGNRGDRRKEPQDGLSLATDSWQLDPRLQLCESLITKFGSYQMYPFIKDFPDPDRRFHLLLQISSITDLTIVQDSQRM